MASWRPDPLEGTTMAPFDLTGRVAVVTGGSAGIGLGIAEGLGRAGAAIAIWARREDRLRTAAAALVAEGLRVVPVRCDATDEDEVRHAFADTVEQLGEPDIVVANVGVPAVRRRIVDRSLDEWDSTLRGNLTSTFLCFREAARRMIAREAGGSLIAVSSDAAHQASPFIHDYAAAKCGLTGLVRALAHELAPARIRCNVLVPGFTDSERMDRSAMAPRRVQEIMAAIPAARFGLPADLAAAAVYLADPTLSYQTGSELVVDGGLAIMAAQNAAAAAWDAAIQVGGPPHPGQT
jgi:NAD(P)-dependent dehydrogenase (short-subunit alcohol dehydrogenase family)